VGHRAVLKWQPLNLEAKDFRFARKDFQGRLLCADDAWNADQRFEESEGGFGLRINGSIECFEHPAPLVYDPDHMPMQRRRQA
jgi:hypothetical protein